MTVVPYRVASQARQALHERAASNFYVFQRLMQPEVSTREYVDADHIKALSWEMQQIAEGETDRLGVAMPPGHQKSYIISVAFTAWMLGRNPALEIIVASYGDELSTKLAQDTRKVMQSTRYREIFPGTVLASKSPAAHNLRTTRGGYRFATSTGGVMTGLGAGLLIYDDPLKAVDAGSEAARDNAWEFIQATPQRIREGNGAVIVAMQRLHADDPIGRLKEQGIYKILELPARFTLPTEVRLGRDKVKMFEPGDVLFPERYDAASLDRRRAEVGERVFNAQYLQQPAPPGGGLFALERFKRFELDWPRTRRYFEARILSIDPGVSSDPSGDPTAITLWGVRGLDIYLLHAERGHWTLNQQLNRTLAFAGKATAILIERSHTGIALGHELERMDIRKLQGFTPRGSKYDRAEVAALFMEQGRIYLPRKADWLSVYEKELVMFPHAAHDDFVDSTSQFFNQLKIGFPTFVELECYKPNVPEVRAYLLGGSIIDRMGLKSYRSG